LFSRPVRWGDLPGGTGLSVDQTHEGVKEMRLCVNFSHAENSFRVVQATDFVTIVRILSQLID
jgi:hypothetical protein